MKIEDGNDEDNYSTYLKEKLHTPVDLFPLKQEEDTCVHSMALYTAVPASYATH